MTVNKPITRVGLLLDEPRVMKWMAQALADLIKQTSVSIPLIIINKEANLESDKLTELKKILFISKRNVQQKILSIFITYTRKILRGESPWIQRVPINTLSFLKNSQKIYCKPIAIGKYGTDLPKAIIDKIKEANVHLLIRRGFGILKGEVLKSTPFGVLGYHDGDIRKYRGSMSRTRAFCNEETYIWVTLQQLTEELDGGKIVFEKPVYVKNLKSYKEVNDKINIAMSTMLSEAVKRLNDPNFKPYRPEKLGENYRMPGLIGFVALLFKFWKTEFRRRVRK